MRKGARSQRLSRHGTSRSSFTRHRRPRLRRFSRLLRHPPPLLTNARPMGVISSFLDILSAAVGSTPTMSLLIETEISPSPVEPSKTGEPTTGSRGHSLRRIRSRLMASLLALQTLHLVVLSDPESWAAETRTTRGNRPRAAGVVRAVGTRGRIFHQR